MWQSWRFAIAPRNLRNILLEVSAFAFSNRKRLNRGSPSWAVGIKHTGRIAGLEDSPWATGDLRHENDVQRGGSAGGWEGNRVCEWSAAGSGQSDYSIY